MKKGSGDGRVHHYTGNDIKNTGCETLIPRSVCVCVWGLNRKLKGKIIEMILSTALLVVGPI